MDPKYLSAFKGRVSLKPIWFLYRYLYIEVNTDKVIPCDLTFPEVTRINTVNVFRYELRKVGCPIHMKILSAVHSKIFGTGAKSFLGQKLGQLMRQRGFLVDPNECVTYPPRSECVTYPPDCVISSTSSDTTIHNQVRKRPRVDKESNVVVGNTPTDSNNGKSGDDDYLTGLQDALQLAVSFPVHKDFCDALREHIKHYSARNIESSRKKPRTF